MVESIGYLTLIAAGVYLVILYLSNQDDFEIKKAKFIKYNINISSFNRDYEQSLAVGKPIMTKSAFKKAIEKMMNDPKIIEAVEKRIAAEETRKNQYEATIKKQRKVGYKYEDSIFEIFGENRELPIEDIILGIKELYGFRGFEKLDYVKAYEIFHIWLGNELIQKCPWNEKRYQVGSVLENMFYSLDKEDLTRGKWLELKGLKLKPTSKEYDDYMDKLPF